MANERKSAPIANGTRGPDASDPAEERHFYDARFDVSFLGQPSSRYIVFSSQRSGSTYLCRRLCNVRGRFGLPSEYLDPDAIRAFGPRLGTQHESPALAEYMPALHRIRTTPDGCFGIKVQPPQLLARIPPDRIVRYLQRYDRIIALTRRDKLGAAISAAIAQATGRWFPDGGEPALETGAAWKLSPDIALQLHRLVTEERLITDAASQAGRPLLYLEYEEILASPEASFDRVLAFLGEPGGAAAVEESATTPVPRKGGGEQSALIRKRFLEYISGIGWFSQPWEERLRQHKETTERT